MNLVLTELRNVFLGGNVSSMSLISTPREMMHYVSETLFLQRQFTRHGLPHKNVADVFLIDSQEIRLLSLRDSWFNIVPSYL